MNIAIVLASLLVVLTFITPVPALGQAARAEFRNAQGEAVGTATLTDDPEGARIRLQLSKLPPGTHGIHIHAVGRCDPLDFTSAGGHFNPEGRKHGQQNPEGAHAGDLPNLTVSADGSANVELLARDVVLGSETNSHSLFPPTGTSLVIHANPDDAKTDPAGNAGARIACGVITR
jgi:superoxide dismutase, Cu-Zn family